MAAGETWITTQCNRRRGLSAVALLLLYLPSLKAGAQHAPVKPKTLGASTESEQAGRKVVHIRISKFEPKGSQRYEELDSNGVTELETALQNAVGRNGNLELKFVREEDINDILLGKGKLAASEESKAPMARAAPFQYQISATYIGLSPGHFRADAKLVQVNPVQHTSVAAEFDKNDPDPTAQLGVKLAKELRRLLGLQPVPSYKLVPCLQTDGGGDTSKSEEMSQARTLVTTFVRGALVDLWLVKLVDRWGESTCAQESRSEAQEKGELHLIVTITAIVVAPSGAPSSGRNPLYFLRLAVERGPLQEREVLESVQSPEACTGVPDLVKMTVEQSKELKKRLNDPAFQSKLETD